MDISRRGRNVTLNGKRYALSDFLWFAALVAPALLLLGTFIFWPIVQSFVISFTDWNLIRTTWRFVGLKNYQDLLSSPVFWQVARNTAAFTFFTVFIRLAISLLLAQLLSTRVPFRSFFRTLVFLPHVTTTAVVAILWLFIFDPYFGPLRPLFEWFGRSPPVWVADERWAMTAIIIVAIWKWVGFSTIVYLAGLTSVEVSLQEAGRIDGATEWQVFRFITFPQLSPYTLFLVITGILHAMQTFDIPALMTEGGPFNSTNLYVYYLYELAFQRFRAGYASALTSVFFVVMLVITMINIRLSKRWVYY